MFLRIRKLFVNAYCANSIGILLIFDVFLRDFIPFICLMIAYYGFDYEDLNESAKDIRGNVYLLCEQNDLEPRKRHMNHFGNFNTRFEWLFRKFSN